MRNLFLVLVLVGLAACEDDVLPTKPVATQRKARPAISAAIVAMPNVDTIKASSICRASARAGGKARLRLDEAPGQALAQKRVVAYAALVADACK
jgi:hypothetical protein